MKNTSVLLTSILVLLLGTAGLFDRAGEPATPVMRTAQPPSDSAPPPQPDPPAPTNADHPLLTPAASGLSQELLATAPSAEQEISLAEEMNRWPTRDARELVSVISSAVGEVGGEFPVTYLLAIAFAETSGKVLAVSPAGAAGLAQATPAAYLSERFEGRVYITNEYLVGTRAYIMKKPLGDAMSIAALLIKSNDAPARARAKELLASAQELRTEGIEELEVLEPHAPAIFMERVRAADAYNVKTLGELERLLDRRASTAEIRRFRDRVEKEYRSLMRVQQISWKRYADDLAAARDRLLRAEYGMDPVKVIQTRAYEAGEVLGERLDARFSPTQMAKFLTAHLSTKRREALALGVADHELEEWTAALYNGGGHNVKRMRAGLIGALRETQNYMRKVPASKQRLDRLLAPS
ncbi:MAG TPA: hypothetical protein VMT00_10955 [Thermoanaerobaculia bacterium]|nr:hypothetical protein [Thermoanaerobaculia bacterium]